MEPIDHLTYNNGRINRFHLEWRAGQEITTFQNGGFDPLLRFLRPRGLISLWKNTFLGRSPPMP
jgi:hypothetical protein